MPNPTGQTFAPRYAWRELLQRWSDEWLDPVLREQERPEPFLCEVRVARWLGNAGADDTTTDPDIRLAALVHRARCVPQTISVSTVPTAVDLLRRLTPAYQTTTGEKACRDGSAECVCAPATDAASPGTSPQTVVAFADLEGHNRVHSPTTSLLRTFHRVLDLRVSERTILLTEQLRGPDPATRYDAIRIAQDLIGSWRGNHARLVMLIADCLLPEDPYTAAAVAESLGSPVPVCEPAREALATFVAAHRTAHGPAVWAKPEPLLPPGSPRSRHGAGAPR